jgi:hypothetical protein
MGRDDNRSFGRDDNRSFGRDDNRSFGRDDHRRLGGDGTDRDYRGTGRQQLDRDEYGRFDGRRRR